MTSEDHDHKHCLEMFEKLSEYLDDELDQITCQEIERHVKECVPCFICLQTLKRTVDLCKQENSRPVPETMSKKLQEIIKHLPKTSSV